MLEDTAPPPQDIENYSILCDPGAQFLCYAVVCVCVCVCVLSHSVVSDYL